ncbi:MAG: hypothetical protein AAGJ34_05530 [Pseudomonadota bacterium]
MIKIVTLFLIALAILAMLGRLRLPKFGRRSGKLPGTARCKKCGALKIENTSCVCEKGTKP